MVNAKAIWARGSGVYFDGQVHLIIVTCIHLKDLKCMDVHWVQNYLLNWQTLNLYMFYVAFLFAFDVAYVLVLKT